MSDPSQLHCMCQWAGEPGAHWRERAWKNVRARLHRMWHLPRLHRRTP